MGQISMFDGEEPLIIDKPIRLIELFAGIGSQAKALKNIGADFERYRICEFDKYAVESYNAVHGTNFDVSDITQISADDLAVVETDKYCYILTYSFPCTDLSVAGKQAGMQRGGGTRSGLLWEVERLLREMKELPQILLMENVPAIVSDKFIGDFSNWIEFLDSIGYTSKWAILNAKDYGIPQNRERCFMVSWLGNYYYEFPEPVKLELRLKNMLEKEVDDRYWLSDYALRQFEVHKQRNALNGNGFGMSTVEGGDLHTPLIAGQTEQTATSSKSRIEYVGSLRPDKQIQDRARVISPDGICHTLTATDYKDPPKIAVDERSADGIYTGVTEAFQRGPLKDVSRTIKATQHDA